MKIFKNEKVEGTRLVHLTPNNKIQSLQDSFTGYVMMYAKSYNFTPSMAAFINRTHAHEWFTKEFVAPSTDQEVESLAIWKTFLTPRLIVID